MGPQTAVRALVLMGMTALVVIGLGFGAYAFYLAWLQVLSPLAAAVVTSSLLLTIPAIWIVIVALFAGVRPRAKIEDNTLAALASFARDNPLSAVLLAGLFGAASAFNAKK